jgi:hypothetical protein
LEEVLGKVMVFDCFFIRLVEVILEVSIVGMISNDVFSGIEKGLRWTAPIVRNRGHNKRIR